MFKKFFLAALVLNFSILYANAYQGLSARQLARVEAAQKMLGAADDRALSTTIDTIEKSPWNEGALEIFEAVAATYNELVRKYQLTDKKAQERLLDKVRMNMAYFQLGGQDVERSSGDNLNIVIRRLLKTHLSAQLRSDRRFFKSLD